MSMQHYLIFALLLLNSCVSEKVAQKDFLTERIIVVVVDGPRYTETWGEPTHQYMPFMDSVMKNKGVVFTSFYNNGITYTTPGHTAITTGYYQNINNYGSELPLNPSFMQLWLKQYGYNKNKAWIIASKDKLEVLGNSSNQDWADKFIPSMNCGVNGLGIGSGYRSDSLTQIEVMKVFNDYHPDLLFINYKEPDAAGHQNSWFEYIDGIKKCDKYIQEIWEVIQSDEYYKNKTTLFITNDHGRHLNTVADGFVSHGDNCEGCRHIFCYAYGPDIKVGEEVNQARELIDINATVLELLEIRVKSSQGEVLTEILK
jgi:arylsulfatase A-like enzyme